MKFELGNDAMRSTSDVAGALRYVANRVLDIHPGGPHAAINSPDTGGKILDANGNGVGRWEIGDGE